LTPAEVSVKDSSILLTSNGELNLRFQKQLPAQSGKFYMLECEAASNATAARSSASCPT